MEKTLRDTLLTAERVMTEARQNARKEADLILRNGKITTLDEQIGRVLDALEAHGYLDNSLVIFAADHGVAAATKVSAYPTGVTEAMFTAYQQGRSTISAFARPFHSGLSIV